MKVAVVGATGLVGRTMLSLLHERAFPADEVWPVASERSVGSLLPFGDGELAVIGLEEALAKAPDLALFSAGAALSREWAPRFAERGTRVIDNSSAWRMEPDVPLLVPEVNGKVLNSKHYLIANPNCSTIQLVMVLHPLHQRYGLQRVIVSTYQSVTGTGKGAVEQMEQERKGEKGPMVYPYPIDRNCLPHCDDFLDNGYTKEEMKLTQESVKILGEPVPVTATAVRVPVVGGHSESVNLEFSKPYLLGDVRKLLADSPGLQLQDNPDFQQYPMPRYAQGKDEVFVGRLRRDLSRANCLNLWIVADNLRKGAALNALQIAELILARGF